MRVLHLPLEVGNQINEICSSLRLLGHTAMGLNWRNVAYIGYDQTVIQADAFEMANAWEDLVGQFDIFHYHTGYTVFSDKSDILLALEAGKKVVMHHRGNDVRIPILAKKLNPHVYTGNSLPTDQIINNLKFFSRHLSTAIVQDYELFDYVSGYYKHVHVLPRFIDTSRIKPLSEGIERDIPLVVHAPTSREFKGTDVIVKTARALQKEIRFDFALIEKTRQKDVLKIMAGADIVIDQVLCGAYGNVSVEAMALSRPVICYIRPDIYKKMSPKPPVVSAHPGQLYDELKRLLLNRELRRHLGKLGRSYVEKVHESTKVAGQLQKIYEGL